MGVPSRCTRSAGRYWPERPWRVRHGGRTLPEPGGGVARGPGGVRFRPPVQRRGMIRRARLLERLEAVPPDVPLIVLSAPAGYGKTTALSQWAAARADPVAWVTLDATDTDPVQLARHIVLALHGAAGLPEAAMTALVALRSAGRGVALR